MENDAPGLAFWLESDSQKACEIARRAGFDIVIFDMEHGVLDELALDRLVPFCAQLGLTPYVRVSEATAASSGGDSSGRASPRASRHACSKW